MSSDGDIAAFQNSVESNVEPVLFQDKNWTFITDSTSNSGSFSSGQIQFDLATLNSQSQWINLPEAVIEFPVKITAQTTAATALTAGPLTTIIKNGWHSFIDSAQLIINGQTVQSSQPYENVSAQFRILSKWSQDTLNKWGPSCGFALDDCTGKDTTAYSAAIGLSNAPSSVLTTSAPARGYDCVNNQSVLFNKGVAARAQLLNNNAVSTTLQGSILGTANMKTAGRSNTAGATTAATAGLYGYSMFAMATVRVKDIFDIEQFPMVKNLKGFMYLSFNSAQTSISTASVSYTPLTGRTNPILINTGTGGITLTSSAVNITATVDGTTNGAVGASGPILTNARLLTPYYIANPKVDAALSKTTTFSTFEKIVNPITATAGQTINYTISVGVPNPRKLILLPMYQDLGGSGLTNPEYSAFDTVPQTSAPFAYLNNLQVYVGNKPMYQYPVQYDYEQFIQEQAQLGLNGALIDQQTSGLLNEQLWTGNHRFYVCDISRRLESEDGMSKSVQVSFTNGSPTYSLKVIAIVVYEKYYSINTATCQLTSGK